MPMLVVTLNSSPYYLPLLYVLAQRDAGEPVSFFNVAIDLASISMTGVRIG